MQQTVVEEIATARAQKLAPGELAHAGVFVTTHPRHIMTHDNTSAVMAKFRSIVAVSTHDPRQSAFAIDHDIQYSSLENPGKYARIEASAREQGVEFHVAKVILEHKVGTYDVGLSDTTLEVAEEVARHV